MNSTDTKEAHPPELASQPSKTEQLMQGIRKTPIFNQLIPQEAGVGWLMPLRKQGKVYAIIPFFGMQKKPEHTALFPPFATITVDWANLQPVEYVNLYFRNSLPEGYWQSSQVGTFPHPAVANLKRSEYETERQKLLFLYDEMFDFLTQNITFQPEWTEQFSHSLRILMEPSLEPYYRSIAPKFFDRFLPQQ
jgi:hypothetical protein